MCEKRKFRNSKTTENYEKYKRQRNKVNNLTERAKQNYNINLLDENSKNVTSFWRILKSIFPTKPKSKLLVDDIRKNIHNDLLTGVLYLDLSKAFDTVGHSCLLSKLPSYGISGNEFTWFGNSL